MTAEQPATRLEPSSDTDALYARIFESGRKRGLAECPCGTQPGAEDLLRYEDGYDEGIEDGQRQGAIRALCVLAGLGAFALWLGRQG